MNYCFEPCQGGHPVINRELEERARAAGAVRAMNLRIDSKVTEHMRENQASDGMWGR